MPRIHGRAPVALLPESPAALVGLALILLGLGVIVAGRTVPKAYGLAGLIALVFFVQTASVLFTDSDPVIEELAFRSGPFGSGEQWWSPLTYMFVHAGLLHFFGNILLLVVVGPILEDRLGPLRFLIVYLSTGALVVTSHLAMTYLVDPPIVAPWQGAVGASGAIFAILTVVAYHWPMERVPFPAYFMLIWLPAFLALMLHLAINLAIMVSGSTGIAWYGHFGGFLLGIAAAVVFKPSVARDVSTRKLPDPSKLEPLATTPALKDILERLRQTTGTARDDPAFAEAWLDRFFAKARCPAGHTMEREGLSARCAAGEYQIAFGR